MPRDIASSADRSSPFAVVKSLALSTLMWSFACFTGCVVWQLGAALMNVVAARSWIPHECVIKRSDVHRSYNSGAVVRVEFGYVVEATTYRSQRVRFFDVLTVVRAIHSRRRSS